MQLPLSPEQREKKMVSESERRIISLPSFLAPSEKLY
jgi:hypothetical protein